MPTRLRRTHTERPVPRQGGARQQMDTLKRILRSAVKAAKKRRGK
jgi:hypothetical protein